MGAVASAVRLPVIDQSFGCSLMGYSHAIYPLARPAEFEVAAGLFTSFNTCEDRRR